MAGQVRKSSFTLSDNAFKRSLEIEFKKAEINSARELLQLGIKVKNRAQLYTAVDKGSLRASWYVKEGVDERGPWVDVGNPQEYAEAQEFGARPHEIPNAWGTGRTVLHPGNEANPMIRPALLEETTSWKPRNIT